MALVNDRDRARLAELFGRQLKEPVTVHFFTQGASLAAVPAQPCFTCRETAQLLDELGGTSSNIRIQTHDLVAEAEELCP